jgi:hypothetical protein
LSLITRAFGSPKTPHIVCSGRKPGKQYASTSRRIRKDRRAIQSECQIPRRPNTQNLYAMHSFLCLSAPHFTHTNPRRPSFFGPASFLTDAPTSFRAETRSVSFALIKPVREIVIPIG